jgi:Zinc finger, C3HC4 type (RING finger)
MLVPEQLRERFAEEVLRLRSSNERSGSLLLPPATYRDLLCDNALVATLRYASDALTSAERLQAATAQRAQELQQQYDEYRRSTPAHVTSRQRVSAAQLQREMQSWDAWLNQEQQPLAAPAPTAAAAAAAEAAATAFVLAAHRRQRNVAVARQRQRSASTDSSSSSNSSSSSISDSRRNNNVGCRTSSGGGSSSIDTVSMSAAAVAQLSLPALNQRESALEAALATVRTAQRAAQDSEAEQRTLCCVCQDAKKSVLLLPCRHLCLCAGCCRRLRGSGGLCPICRVLITDSLEVYT